MGKGCSVKCALFMSVSVSNPSTLIQRLSFLSLGFGSQEGSLAENRRGPPNSHTHWPIWPRVQQGARRLSRPKPWIHIPWAPYTKSLLCCILKLTGSTLWQKAQGAQINIATEWKAVYREWYWSCLSSNMLIHPSALHRRCHFNSQGFNLATQMHSRVNGSNNPSHDKCLLLSLTPAARHGTSTRPHLSCFLQPVTYTKPLRAGLDGSYLWDKKQVYSLYLSHRVTSESVDTSDQRLTFSWDLRFELYYLYCKY